MVHSSYGAYSCSNEAFLCLVGKTDTNRGFEVSTRNKKWKVLFYLIESSNI